MNLLLQSGPSKDKATSGSLFVDGVWECYTLEDEVREVPGQPVSTWKVPKETAIPAGRYKVTLETSARFGPDTITINAVPGFVGVRMHGGNTAEDTEGCPLVGTSLDWDSDRISGASLGCLDQLKDKIRAGLANGGAVWIDVIRT